MRKGQKWSLQQRNKFMNNIKTRDYYGENNPKWRGGRIVRTDGRVCVYAPNHPHANLYNGTHILEYRLIAEEKIGRYLLPTEIVHHIDGNVLNNNPDNLEVITQSEHCKLHFQGESANSAKLKNKDIIYIRSKYKKGAKRDINNPYSVKNLSIKFGVNKTTIQKIVNNENWKHI